MISGAYGLSSCYGCGKEISSGEEYYVVEIQFDRHKPTFDYCKKCKPKLIKSILKLKKDLNGLLPILDYSDKPKLSKFDVMNK